MHINKKMMVAYHFLVVHTTSDVHTTACHSHVHVPRCSCGGGEALLPQALTGLFQWSRGERTELFTAIFAPLSLDGGLTCCCLGSPYDPCVARVSQLVALPA